FVRGQPDYRTFEIVRIGRRHALSNHGGRFEYPCRGAFLPAQHVAEGQAARGVGAYVAYFDASVVLQDDLEPVLARAYGTGSGVGNREEGAACDHRDGGAGAGNLGGELDARAVGK